MAENSLPDLDIHLKALEPFFLNSEESLERLNKYLRRFASLLFQVLEASEDVSHSYGELMEKHERLMKKVKRS